MPLITYFSQEMEVGISITWLIMEHRIANEVNGKQSIPYCLIMHPQKSVLIFRMGKILAFIDFSLMAKNVSGKFKYLICAILIQGIKLKYKLQ